MTTYYGASDIDAQLAEFGVPVVIGGVTVKGIVNIADPEMLAGEGLPQHGEAKAVYVKTEGMPTASINASITIEGVAYRILSTRRAEGAAAEPDGAFTRIVCAL